MEPEKKVVLPTQPVEIVHMTKNGAITIPKKVRETLEENSVFAFWREDTRLIFQIVKEYEIQDLNVQGSAHKSSESHTTTSSDDIQSEDKLSKVKKKSVPSIIQPELTRYFPFPYENQEKVQNLLENTFYKLIEPTPNIPDVLERLKYILVNYSTGNTTNDARIRNSIILFINDAINKVEKPLFQDLIQYAYEKIVPSINSAFLKEQSQIILAVTALKANQISIASELIKEILTRIDHYSENFAIMQGFKGLIKTMVKNPIPYPDEIKLLIRDRLVQHITGFEIQNDPPIHRPPSSSDFALQLIDLLVDLQLIDTAYEQTEQLLARLLPEDIQINQVRARLQELGKKSI